jgi:hypothetical protein
MITAFVTSVGVRLARMRNPGATTTFALTASRSYVNVRKRKTLGIPIMNRETREEKAERLVRDGRVRQPAFFLAGWGAYVEGDHGIYWVLDHPDGRFWCECEYGRYHNGTEDRCSHALALAVAVGERGR